MHWCALGGTIISGVIVVVIITIWLFGCVAADCGREGKGKLSCFGHALHIIKIDKLVIYIAISGFARAFL